jgi:hypothetical protein
VHLDTELCDLHWDEYCKEPTEMQLRLKTQQTPQECAATRCKRGPNGQYLGVGYLCENHANKTAAAREAGTLELIGAPPIYGNTGGAHALAAPVVLDPEMHALSLEDAEQTAQAAIDATLSPQEAAWRAEQKAKQPAPPTELEVKTAASEFEEALAMVRDFDLETDEDAAFAEAERADAKKQWDTWEAKRKSLTVPMNEALRNANAMFKPVLGALAEIRKVWGGKLVELKQRRETEQAALLAQAQTAATPEETQAALVAASEAILQPVGTAFVDNWKFEVTDLAALPREYLQPDERKIKGVVKALKDKTTIPGIRTWNEPYAKSTGK